MLDHVNDLSSRAASIKMPKWRRDQIDLNLSSARELLSCELDEERAPQSAAQDPEAQTALTAVPGESSIEDPIEDSYTQSRGLNEDSRICDCNQRRAHTDHSSAHSSSAQNDVAERIRMRQHIAELLVLNRAWSREREECVDETQGSKLLPVVISSELDSETLNLDSEAAREAVRLAQATGNAWSPYVHMEHDVPPSSRLSNDDFTCKRDWILDPFSYRMMKQVWSQHDEESDYEWRTAATVSQGFYSDRRERPSNASGPPAAELPLDGVHELSTTFESSKGLSYPMFIVFLKATRQTSARFWAIPSDCGSSRQQLQMRAFRRRARLCRAWRAALEAHLEVERTVAFARREPSLLQEMLHGVMPAQVPEAARCAAATRTR